MCGIVGYTGKRDAQEVIISGLEKLEYRGYDSAGIAVFEKGQLKVTRAEGKLIELKTVLADIERKDLPNIGIGHTRWATHGKPSENNAHPHSAGRISLIHNGIIENYVELREKLSKQGAQFKSETDTEIAAHLINTYVEKGLDIFSALKEACKELDGSYAFLVMDAEDPTKIAIAKSSTPIVIGIGEGEMFVASDVPAILEYTRDVVILEDGDFAEITADSLKIEDRNGAVERSQTRITWDPVTAQKGGYKHYMLKEIHDQPAALADTFRGRLEIEDSGVSLSGLDMTDEEIENIDRISLVACGTAWHACLGGKFYIEELAGIPCEVDYASEFRYRKVLLNEKTLVVSVSQSGETADTLAAVNLANQHSPTLAVCNVLGSSIARQSKHVVYTHAGPEISVASTKAFTTQLTALYLLAIYLGKKKGRLSTERAASMIENLIHLPGAIEESLKDTELIQKVGKKFHLASDFLFLGRGNCYPIALEGALKLKEISYIHAEGYPAGEMKHGPIALVDEKLPVVVVLQRSDLMYQKTLSNLREVESRQGHIIAITDVENTVELEELCDYVLKVPHISPLLSPIILTIPMQLLAYYVAVANGTDVDLPRNLAKSVTVE